jgi:hypothetical protein
MAYKDSGRLLPLIADGAEIDFRHIFLHTRFHTGYEVGG